MAPPWPHPAPPAWTRLQPANQAAGPWVSKRDLGWKTLGRAHWPPRSRASFQKSTCSHALASTRLQRGPRAHDMGLCRGMQHPTSASSAGLGHTANGGTRTEIASNQHCAFTRHTHQPRNPTDACQQHEHTGREQPPPSTSVLERGSVPSPRIAPDVSPCASVESGIPVIIRHRLEKALQSAALHHRAASETIRALLTSSAGADRRATGFDGTEYG